MVDEKVVELCIRCFSGMEREAERCTSFMCGNGEKNLEED